MKGLDGKRVIVTGGAKGIGRAACERLVGEGAAVAILDLDREAGEALARELSERGPGRAAFHELDAGDEASVDAAVSAAEESLGGLDGLVNNAGISGVNAPPHEISLEDWREVQRVNVDGVFLMTKRCVGALRTSDAASIVNLSSIYGIVGAPDIPPYHASKGAVREMTKVDALFYADDGIRVNSVHPGFIWTPLVEDLAERSGEGVDAFRRELDGRHPIGHAGRPEDVGAAIAFLLSDDAAFMTGSEMVVDGGYTCR